jgi:hypothetical protein
MVITNGKCKTTTFMEESRVISYRKAKNAGWKTQKEENIGKEGFFHEEIFSYQGRVKLPVEKSKVMPLMFVF